MSLIVYKIGGSLFDLPGLSGVIREVLFQRPQQQALLIAGGGPAAEVVRQWDRVHHLDEVAAHELAIEAMDLTASLLARFLPEARLVRSEKQILQAAGGNVISLLCAGCFIKAAESRGYFPLERSWRVTSDSIAAWTGGVLSASELVLVKSIPLPDGMTADSAAQAGLVDEAFPQMGRRLPAIGWVNARSRPPLIEPWHGAFGSPPQCV
jgi:aspartokinase-like uncharacterized kinase